MAPALLQAARTVTLAKFARASFQPYLQSQLKSTIQRFVDDEISEERTIIELLSFCKDTPSQEVTSSVSMPIEGEHAVIMAISRLISYLCECDMKELTEAH